MIWFIVLLNCGIWVSYWNKDLGYLWICCCRFFSFVIKLWCCWCFLSNLIFNDVNLEWSLFILVFVVYIFVRLGCEDDSFNNFFLINLFFCFWWLVWSCSDVIRILVFFNWLFKVFIFFLVLWSWVIMFEIWWRVLVFFVCSCEIIFFRLEIWFNFIFIWIFDVIWFFWFLFVIFCNWNICVLVEFRYRCIVLLFFFRFLIIRVESLVM